MDLDALRHGNFSKLGEAVTDWEQMTKKLADLKKEAEDNLKAKADKAAWAGVNATVSREFITKTAAEFADAHAQADSIAKILSDARGEIISYRTQLNDTITRAAKQHLSVIDTGKGTFTVTGNARPDWAADPSGESSTTDQKAADVFRDEIQAILTKATESDTSAAKVLRLLVDQTQYGFNDASYHNRDEAANAFTAAEKLAKMAKNPAEMTLKEIADFNRLMEKYHDDPVFAERFAQRMGAKGTLQFWTEMTSANPAANGSDLDTLKSLQKNLSMTLATASHSDSEAMQQWKRDLVGENNTSFRANNSSSPFGVLGSQVTSSLMHQGRYDTEFLDAYREKLFKSDKGAGEKDTDDLWVKANGTPDLVFGKGNGRDPLEGLFKALSHNPEAATNAFQSKADVTHLLGSVPHTERGETLGPALVAATTGIPADGYGHVPQPHSERQVNVMANVTAAVAQPNADADLVTGEMGEAFGRMAAAYMPEISLEMAGDGAESIMTTDSSAPKGLDKTDVTRFLYRVAQDDNGRAAIILGENIYTGSLLEAHIADPSLYGGRTTDALSTIAENSGLIEGIVAHSVADADIEETVETEKAANDAFKKQGDFFKSVISSGAGIGAIALVPATPTGALAGAAAGGFFGGVASMAIDRVMEGKEIEGAIDDALYRSGKDLNKAEESSLQQTQWSAEEAIKAHESGLNEEATKNEIRRAHSHGWTFSDSILEDVVPRPSN